MVVGWPGHVDIQAWPEFVSLHPDSDPLPSCLTGNKGWMRDRPDYVFSHHYTSTNTWQASPAMVTNVAGNVLIHVNHIDILLINYQCNFKLLLEKRIVLCDSKCKEKNCYQYDQHADSWEIIGQRSRAAYDKTKYLSDV